MSSSSGNAVTLNASILFLKCLAMSKSKHNWFDSNGWHFMLVFAQIDFSTTSNLQVSSWLSLLISWFCPNFDEFLLIALFNTQGLQLTSVLLFETIQWLWLMLFCQQYVTMPLYMPVSATFWVYRWSISLLFFSTNTLWNKEDVQKSTFQSISKLQGWFYFQNYKNIP